MKYIVTVIDEYVVEVTEDDLSNPNSIEDILRDKIDIGDCEWINGSFDVN